MTGNAPAFLNTELPPWGARSLAACLIAVFAVAVVGSVIIRLPETVVCPFVLVPREGLDPVRASSDGVIIDVRVADAQTVAKGQELFVIRSDSTADRSGESSTLELQITGARAGLANARKKHDNERLADQLEEARLKARGPYLTRKTEATRSIQQTQERILRIDLDIAVTVVESIKEETTLKQRASADAKRALETSAKLYAGLAMSEHEYLQIRLEADRTNVAVHQSLRELEAAKLKVAQLKSQSLTQQKEGQLALEQLAIESQENETALSRLGRQRLSAEATYAELERTLNETIDKAKVRLEVLQKELQQSQGGEVVVTAPRAGSVLRLRTKAAGTFVRSGEVLCELAGVGDRLQAELTVPQSGVGRIAPDQRVRLLYDAFPYQRHGIRYGTVRWTSPAGEAATDGGTFRVLVDNDDTSIWADGQLRTLLAGMGGRAEVMVGKRSLLEYAFEPLRRLKENLAEPPLRTHSRGGQQVAFPSILEAARIE
jgi:multidrug efflux pump subunit AcrA (membrane-fusion protein)